MNDILNDIDGITARAMFGGYGIYQHGLFFALIADDELFFKVDDVSKAKYEAAGSHPFTYSSKNNKIMTMGYWQLPEEVMLDRMALRDWVDEAVAVARAAKK